MADQSNVINIAGVDYKENELEVNQQYLVMQIRDLQKQLSTLKFKSDQTQAALQSMTNDLIASVSPSNEVVNE